MSAPFFPSLVCLFFFFFLSLAHVLVVRPSSLLRFPLSSSLLSSPRFVLGRGMVSFVDAQSLVPSVRLVAREEVVCDPVIGAETTALLAHLVRMTRQAAVRAALSEATVLRLRRFLQGFAAVEIHPGPIE